MKHLPERPSLGFLRREARSLKSSYRARDQRVCAPIRHFDISFHDLRGNEEFFDQRFSILDAQRVVARRYGFASWARLKKFVQGSAVESVEHNAKLRKKIKDINRRLNELTTAIKSKRRSRGGRTAKQRRLMAMVDEYESTALSYSDFVNSVYDDYGWPGPEIIGRDGVDSLYFVVGHMVLSSDIQTRTTQLMERALPAGRLYGYYYANLLDRRLALANEPTVFGVAPGFDDEGRLSLSRDVIDPEGLDSRRATVGLDPFAVDVQRVFGAADRSERGPKPNRVEWEAYRDDLALRGGYRHFHFPSRR